MSVLLTIGLAVMALAALAGCQPMQTRRLATARRAADPTERNDPMRRVVATDRSCHSHSRKTS